MPEIRVAVFSLVALLGPVSMYAQGTVRDVRAIGDVLYAAGEQSLLLQSTDDGRTWTTLTSSPGAHWEALAGDANALVLLGGSPAPGNPIGAGRSAILRRARGDANFAPLPSRPPGWLRGGLVHGDLAAVFGQATPRTPSGAVRTVSGGRRWTPVPSKHRGPLLGGAFRSWREGYLLGPGHRILALRNLKEPADRPADVEAELALRCGAFVAKEAFWAAGDEGLLLRRQPPGEPWSTIPLKLPPGTTRLADFHAIASDADGRVWLGGGTVGYLLHTPDAGRTWKTLPAPAPGAVRSLRWLAGDTLVAGGTAGRLWRSTDGGATWTRHHGSERPDVLFIASATDISIWPAVVAHARAGLECVVVFATTPPPNGQVAPDQPCRAAALRAGARGTLVLGGFTSHVLTGHPQASERDILTAWSLDLDADAADVLTRQLAATIRLMRPRVLVTGPTTTHRRGRAGESRLIARLAHRAVDLAADANNAALGAAALEPCRPERVFEGLEHNDQWTAPWNPRRKQPRDPATTLLSLAAFPAGAETNLEMLAQQAAWCLPHAGPLDRPARMQGYALRPGDPSTGNLAMFTTGLVDGQLRYDRDVSRHRDALAGMSYLRLAKVSGGMDAALGRLARAADGAQGDPLLADRLFLAWWRLLAESEPVKARQARDLFLRHGRGHPMFARGLAMALAAEGSAERATLPAGPIAPEGVNKPLRVDKAVEALQSEPGWDGDPGVRLIAASALAARGEGPKAREWAASVRDGAFDPQWTSYADALLGGSGVDVRAKARRTVTASAVGSETTLDGRLDETDWRAAKPLAISPVGDEKTALRGVVRLLRSPSHLLVGLELPREQKRSWEVDLAMDTDRDAATQIVVTFDSAGEKAVTFRSRFAPPMPLPSRPIRLQGRKSDRAFTFELAVPLKLMGQSPQRPGEWNLQIRATAWQRGRTTELYLEPLSGGLDALHRYASLKLPAPKRADRENRNDR